MTEKVIETLLIFTGVFFGTYIAFDEIAYIAEQLAAHMGIAPHYEISKDYLNAMIEKAEDLVMDLENVRDDADGDNHE